MRQYRFYKDELGWFIDLKWFPFNRGYLAMVEGADTLLDVLSEGKSEVTLKVSTSPIPYSEGWLSKDMSLGLMKGAIYDINGIEVDHYFPFSGATPQLWLCPVTIWVFLKYPKKIWFKVVE